MGHGIGNMLYSTAKAEVGQRQKTREEASEVDAKSKRPSGKFVLDICKSCGQKLSKYNLGDECYKCGAEKDHKRAEEVANGPVIK